MFCAINGSDQSGMPLKSMFAPHVAATFEPAVFIVVYESIAAMSDMFCAIEFIMTAAEVGAPVETAGLLCRSVRMTAREDIYCAART